MKVTSLAEHLYRKNVVNGFSFKQDESYIAKVNQRNIAKELKDGYIRLLTEYWERQKQNKGEEYDAGH